MSIIHPKNLDTIKANLNYDNLLTYLEQTTGNKQCSKIIITYIDCRLTDLEKLFEKILELYAHAYGGDMIVYKNDDYDLSIQYAKKIVDQFPELESKGCEKCNVCTGTLFRCIICNEHHIIYKSIFKTNFGNKQLYICNCYDTDIERSRCHIIAKLIWNCEIELGTKLVGSCCCGHNSRAKCIGYLAPKVIQFT